MNKIKDLVIKKYGSVNNCFEQNRDKIIRTTLYRVIKNPKKTSVEILETLAKMLDMTLDELLKVANS